MGAFFSKIFIPVMMLFAGFSEKNCKKYYDYAQGQTFDMVIVPGIPYEGEKWDTLMKGRVYWAKHLYDAGIAKRLMFSGSAVYTPYYESKIMALYAKELGIPESAIYLESRAEHSVENVYYSHKKATELGFSKIALATDPYQSKRLHKFMRTHYRSVAIIPFVEDILKNMNQYTPEINDSSAYEPDFVSITERKSPRERWRGTRGKHLEDKLSRN